MTVKAKCESVVYRLKGRDFEASFPKSFKEAFKKAALEKYNIASSEPVASESSDFVAASSFQGSRIGYAFYMGKQGLGYYWDTHAKVNEGKTSKRKREGDDEGEGSKRPHVQKNDERILELLKPSWSLETP